jgi:disulfide bond formation protein DsbB
MMQAALQTAGRTAGQARRATQGAALAAAAAGAAALGAAFASEWWLGLVPCALCLWERWPYRVLLALGLLALLLRGQAARAALGAAALVALAGAGLGLVHVGVEQGWWPSPLPECAAPALGGGGIAERLARMPAQPVKPCDEPAYLLPGLPVSMAAMGLALSLALAGFLAMSAARRPPAPNEAIP